MAIVAFDLKDLQKANRSKEKLEDVLTRIGVEVEELSKEEIKVNITPNRPDLLDFVGLSRAIEHFTGAKPKDSFYKIENKPALTINATGQIKSVRPFIAGMIVKNANLSGNRLKYLINFTEKFAETYGRKRKKIAIGVHNLSAIEGNLTYEAAKEGKITPLGSKKSMAFDRVMKEHAKGVTYQDTVPNYGSKSVLYPVLKDEKKTIALIPITNCEETKVTEKTKDLFIDITSTSQISIRNSAAVIACSFLYAGAEVHPVGITYDRQGEEIPKLEYQEVKVAMNRAERTIGIITGRHNVIDLANRMGYTAAKYGPNVLFYVPPYRIDVLDEQDIVEDIAIAYGYDRIIPLAISGVSVGMSNEATDYENKLASAMVGLGYTEAINSILTNEEMNFKNMRTTSKQKDYAMIAESKTNAITMLRTVILPGILQDLSASANATMPQRIFEIGRTFTVKNGKIKESKRLAIASEHAKADFSEIKSVVEAILRYMEGSYKIENDNDATFIQGRCARVTLDGKVSAVFGEVHPEVLRNFGIEEPVVAAEIILKEE